MSTKLHTCSCPQIHNSVHKASTSKTQGCSPSNAQDSHVRVGAMLDLTPHLWQLAVALVILLLNTELGRRSP